LNVFFLIDQVSFNFQSQIFGFYMNYDALILVNFGGPRDLDEVASFLKELLCDQDVIRTGFPKLLHNLLFSKIAKKRAKVIKDDYDEIGGKSPIYFDTENLRNYLEKEFKLPVFTFHRYLPKTHHEFLKSLEAFEGNNILVFPMFPQFSYATTGSCARFFEAHLCGRTLEKLEWVSSYEAHPAFIDAFRKNIETTLKQHNLCEQDVCLFYSCHGVPRKFICFDDPYQRHCQRSYESLKKFFPQAQHVLAYQSKFGKGEWLKPYTIDLVEDDLSWLNKKHVLFVPLSFTSDHIETLFEVEQQYLQPLRTKGVDAHRVSALQNDFSWVKKILQDSLHTASTAMLIRKESKACCQKNHGCCLCKMKKSDKDLLQKHEQKNS
jgi:protoporphyrin/coproporphyrin ferrochelatase